MRLNFFTATKAHQAWKQRLYACVCGESPEPLNPEVIAVDNRCDLGKWLYQVRDSQPRLRADTASLFTRLLDDHAAFHVTAATVVRKAQSDQQDDALRQLQGGDYAKISNRVIGALGELYLKRREFGME